METKQMKNNSQPKIKTNKWGKKYYIKNHEYFFLCRICNKYKNNCVAAHMHCPASTCLDCIQNTPTEEIEKWTSECPNCPEVCSDGSCGAGKW